MGGYLWSFTNISVDVADDYPLIKQLLECAGADMDVMLGDGGTFMDYSPFNSKDREQYNYDDGILKPEELFYLIDIMIKDKPFELFYVYEKWNGPYDTGKRKEIIMNSDNHTKEFCSFVWDESLCEDGSNGQEYNNKRICKVKSGDEIEIKIKNDFYGIKPSQKVIRSLISKARHYGFDSLSESLSQI